MIEYKMTSSGRGHDVKLKFEPRIFADKKTGEIIIHIEYTGELFTLKDTIQIPEHKVKELNQLINKTILEKGK